jgi:hypothetical protein
MREAKVVSLVVVAVMILSGTTIALPAGLEIPTRGATGGAGPLDSGGPTPTQANVQNPDVHWTTSFTDVKYEKDYTMVGWSGGKVVASGKKVKEDLKIEVHDFDKHVDLEVEVNGNEVGGNLFVHVYNNPFLLTLKVSVGGNKVGGNIAVIVSTSAVSNLYVGVSENTGCVGLTAIVANNTIDYTMNVGIRENTVTERMVISVYGNTRPAGWDLLFTMMEVYIRDNHVVRKTLQIYIFDNIMAKRGIPTMRIEVFFNGAGKGIWMRIMGNEAYPSGLMYIDIWDNACDTNMRVFVLGNKAYKIFVNVVRNYGCSGSTVRVQKNGIGPVVKEPPRCMQTIAPDSDGDGLTDTYEMMVGTNVTNPDTDNDGLNDGWNDTNKDRTVGSNERYGEIGDPIGHKFKGSVGKLVKPKKHEPNPLCCDIYVEVDHIKGVNKLPKSSIKSLVAEFKTHRIKLHIDDGWGGTAGGGQPLEEDLREYYGDKYLIMGSIVGPHNDFYDYINDRKYYDPKRNDIFHYTVIAPRLATVWNGTINYTEYVVGMAERPGDGLALAQDAIRYFVNNVYPAKERKKAVVTHTAGTFMHELGHNMDLGDTNVTGDRNLTCMYYAIEAISPLDYKEPSEWEAIWPNKVDEA